MMIDNTKVPVSLRIDRNLMDRIGKAVDRTRNPYAPTMTQIIERGIELALRELEKRSK